MIVYFKYMYRDADKSLTRPGSKQARKHVRDTRDFNNIETRAVIRYFSPARQVAEEKLINSFRDNSFFIFTKKAATEKKYKQLHNDGWV